MLFLSNLQERDVVEQQLLERVRGEVQKLLAGTVQEHLLQRLDFAFDVHASHCKPSFVSWDEDYLRHASLPTLLGLAPWACTWGVFGAPFR